MTAYSIPTLSEILATPESGITAVSTFSGGGGACLGMRWAGIRVAWSSEFVKAARETYVANFGEPAPDPRDIRDVPPEEVLDIVRDRCGANEIDLVEGSPPCAAFSMAGSREGSWARTRSYSDTEQRVDDLFLEWLRLVRGIRPRACWAENVKGLAVGNAKGYLREVLELLDGAGYRAKAAILNAASYGVPQSRRRLFILGYRSDLGIEPTFPRAFARAVTIRDALPWIENGENPFPVERETDMSRFALGREWHRVKVGSSSRKYFQLVKPRLDAPCPTITATTGNAGAASVAHPLECRKFSIAEAKRLSGFPDDYRLSGSFVEQYERIGRAVPPPLSRALAREVVRSLGGKLS